MPVDDETNRDKRALQSDLEIASEIAIETGQVVLSYFGTDRVDARSKGERDIVTAADVASERLLLQRLSQAFPGDGVVGEEGTRTASAGTRRWLVDPLDGTVNYSHGIPIWCVSLSLFEGDHPVLGVIHDPIRGETFRGAAGLGAWCNDTPIHCSSLTDAASAMVHLTIDFHEESLIPGLNDIRVIAPRVLRTRNFGSAALALTYVAAGRLDGMIHRLANAWDYGAGVLLVQEAGGFVTDFDSRAYTEGTKALIAAATPVLQGTLLELLRESDSPGLK